MFRKLYKPLLITAISLACGAAVLEGGLRYLGVHDPVLYVKDEAAGYRLKPNQDVSFYGTRIQINRFGLRDGRRFDAKPSGTTRILVLGDSVTWGGIRIAQADLFTAKLERELGGVEVINAGVNGYSVTQMTALHRGHLAALRPDIVLVYVIPGDFLRPPVVDLVRSSPAFPLERPALALSSAFASARIVAAARFGWHWLQPANPAEPREAIASEACVQQNLDAIVGLDRALPPGQQLIVAVSPYIERAENPPLPESVATTLANAGIPLWDLGADALRDPALFVDHIHLSPEGHSRVADALAERLRELNAGDARQ